MKRQGPSQEYKSRREVSGSRTHDSLVLDGVHHVRLAVVLFRASCLLREDSLGFDSVNEIKEAINCRIRYQIESR